MSATLDVKSLDMLTYANGLFGAQQNTSLDFENILSVFGRAARFEHPAAFPDRTKADHIEIKAALASAPNGGERIYLSAADVTFLMDKLKDPQYKVKSDSGKTATAYPKLVEALMQAKANIAIYEAPEMQTYLCSGLRKSDASAAGRAMLFSNMPAQPARKPHPSLSPVKA